MFTAYDVLMVGYNLTRGNDSDFLVVGTKNIAGGVDIINTFSGEEARNLYKMLITKKEVKNA